MSRRYSLILLGRAFLLSAVLVALGAPGRADAELIRIKPGADAAVRAVGGSVIAPELRIWRVPDPAMPALRRAAVVVAAQREHFLQPAAGALDEPLAPDEWWRSVIGADVVAPPGPGKPVTVVDTGLDVTHEEFSARPNTTALNSQTTFFIDDDHGTEVASVVAAPVNGLGLAGVYPQAVLRSWDASPFGFITTGDAIRGIVEAARQGPGVINLSFGGEDDEPLVHQAVLYAFRQGSLVVASSGNDGLADNPLTYPASYPHVLTVSATDNTGFVASFASRSRFVDLTAPGFRIPVAEPTSADPAGYELASGTSFSAPMVSGASAWVWTSRPSLDNTQLFDVMRFSARDVDAPGYDDASGYGLLNIPSALDFPTPSRDPLEPNDAVNQVSPKGLFTGGQNAIVTATKRSATIAARLDRTEDPSDVYRAFVPAHGTLTASVNTPTVVLRISGAAPTKNNQRASVRNTRNRGVERYVTVTPGSSAARPSYVLRVSASVRR